MKPTKQMISVNPIKAAVQLAQQVEVPDDPKLARKKLDKKRYEQRRLQDLRSDLLSIEHEAREDLDKKLRVLDAEIESLVSSLMPNPSTMPVFDMSCLAWRDDKGLPRLVPFCLDEASPRITFGFKSYRTYRNGNKVIQSRFEIQPRLFKSMESQYSDMADTLRKLRQKGKNVSISTKFHNTIPDDIRDLIQGAKTVFEHLAVVAEVSSWEVKHTKAPKAKPQPRPEPSDPLLIGWDGKCWRLIAAFDTTTIEQLAADRSTGKKPS